MTTNQMKRGDMLEYIQIIANACQNYADKKITTQEIADRMQSLIAQIHLEAYEAGYADGLATSDINSF